MRLRTRFGDLELRVPSQESLAETVALDETVAISILRVALAEGDEHRYRSLLAQTRSGCEPGSRRPLLEQLSRAVARGELVFVRRKLITVSGTRPEPAPAYVPPPPPSPAESEVLDWIEIVVEDQDGRPLREIDYELTLPDGSVRRGRSPTTVTARPSTRCACA